MRIKCVEDYYELKVELSREFNISISNTEYMIDIIDELYSYKFLNAISKNSVLIGHLIRNLLELLNVNYSLKIRKIEFHFPRVNEIYIPGTKYYLNIKEGVKNVLLFLFTYWITKGYSLAILVDILNNILKPSIAKIQDFEYCVLATIISQSKSLKEFNIENVIDNMSSFLLDECNNCSNLWNCPYCENNICSISKTDIENAINSLRNKNVISFSDNGNYILNK